jgi:transposase
MGESMLIEGSANAVVFEQYIEKILAPCLTEGQIVLMDNLAAHKSAKVEALIQARGCQLLFLPSYSPDFSPYARNVLKTENAFASGRCSHT